MSKQYSIGGIGFAPVGVTNPYRRDYEHPMGDLRVDLLRKFYRREDLGDWVAWVMPSCGGAFVCKWEDVRWDTAGDRVTGSDFS